MQRVKYAIDGVHTRSGKDLAEPAVYIARYDIDAIFLARDDGISPTRLREIGRTDEPLDERLVGLGPDETYGDVVIRKIAERKSS